MKYAKKDAKSYARANMTGIWAAALTPFNADFSIDEDGLAANLRHWSDDLKIDGVFVAGKQGEFFSLSIPERKRLFDIAARTLDGRAGTIMSCSPPSAAARDQWDVLYCRLRHVSIRWS